MEVSEITEESGSALTFHTFAVMGVEPELFWERGIGEGFYWMPITEKRQDDPKKPARDVAVGIKMAYPTREQAEDIRNGILNSGT